MTDPPDVAAPRIRTRSSRVPLVAVNLGRDPMEPTWMLLTVEPHQRGIAIATRPTSVISGGCRSSQDPPVVAGGFCGFRDSSARAFVGRFSTRRDVLSPASSGITPSAGARVPRRSPT